MPGTALTSLLQRPPRREAAYAAAAAVAVAAALLQWGIRPWVGDRTPYLFYMPALVFVAVILGRGPSLVILLAGAANAALLADARGRVDALAAGDGVLLFVYLLLGILISLYGSRLSVTTARAALAEERLAIAQDDTGIGVFELDFEANKAFVSASLCQMLGQPVMQGPISLDRWLGALHPGHVEGSRRAMQERAERGELRYEREQRIDLVDGGVRWFLHRVRMSVTPGGKLAQARGASVDITERKRLDELLGDAKAELQQQVQDLQRLHDLSRKLVGGGDDAVAPLQALIELVVDLHGARHGLLSLCGSGVGAFEVVAQTGFAEHELRKLSPDRPDPSLPRGDAAEFEAFLAAQQSLATRAGFGSVHSTPLRDAAGRPLGVISVMYAQRREPDERQIRLAEVCASTAAAVVERDRARAAAAANERRFAVTLESSAVPFTILAPVRDAAGRIVDFQWSYVNPAGARAIGSEVEALVGRRISEVMQRAWEPPQLFAHYVAVVDRGESREFEVKARVSGEGGWYHVIASPLQGSAAVWFADISERKREEQARQEADRRKDEFLATLAHELRNPLAPIRQAMLVARSPASTAAQKQWSHDIVERQVEIMAALLDDLLDVSRITRGTLPLRRSPVALSTICDAAIETARPHIDARRHSLGVDLPDAPVVLDVDPLRISQVLANLLTNAAKYTDPGGTLRLTARREAGELVIRVSDNGIGLERDQFERLFEMFAQLPSSEGRSQGGLGIGLALSRGFVELHGGRIEVASDGPGQGSEFAVRLPESCVARPSVARRTEADVPVPDPIPQTDEALRILVADDNADAAESMAELLRLEGHEVHVAYDGDQALALFKTVQPDAALLDVGMPGLSGLDVVRAIRRLPSGERAVLIAITGWGQERDQQAAKEAGFDHHATKPVQPAQIRVFLMRGPHRTDG